MVVIDARPLVVPDWMLNPMATVRDTTYKILRRHGLTTLFANPGSTEIAFLGGMPDDFRFILGLHEGSVVGMATGWALGREQPALVNLHTTAGLGNAVAALATARVNRAPLVVVVGQQDRRHLAQEPFLAGRLRGLAGEYPVWTDEPVRAQDVPAAIARAAHEACAGRGPALVIVPSDDWSATMDGVAEVAAPVAVRPALAFDPSGVREIATLLDEAHSPALVAGAGADSAEGWAALVELAERLAAPVWQEAFSARAGFPQDHPLFAGHLSHARSKLRQALAGHDVVLAVGAPVFRQYQFEPGPLVEPGTRLALVTDDPAEAHRSPVEMAACGPIAPACRLLASAVRPRSLPPAPLRTVAYPSPPDPGEPMRAAHVLSALAARLPRNVVLVEETPSSRPALHELVPAREPMGFVAAAMGGLGFGLPAALGIRMARPDRPVVAVLGDGASMYAIQALWSAAHYRVGALLLVMANGRYAVMDGLAEQAGAKAPWPPFEEVDFVGLARSMGCPALHISDYAHLTEVFDETLPTLVDRQDPLLLEIPVLPSPH
jgi:benzoylformate decarboxylase